MGVPAPGKPLTPALSTFSDNILKIELSGPDRQHLSFIDVPGIFRTPTEGVTTKKDVTHVKNMVRSYIKDPRTIILAVVPAPVDIATQEILSMAIEADPSGQRTMGVLTKPDLVDRGGEELVMNLVHGKTNKLNLGYCIVRNRGQQDLSRQSIADRHRVEEQFFSTAPWSALSKERVGIPALQDRLRELLVDITRREFPKVKQEIDKRLSVREQELKLLGPARETEKQQRKFLLELANEFQEVTSYALDAYYGRSLLFKDNPSLRLATRVVNLDTAFSDETSLKGHTLHFSVSTSKSGEILAPDSPINDTASEVGSLAIVEEAANEDISHSISSSTTETVENLELNRFPELSDLIQAPRPCPPPESDNIFDWIESVYRRSRGFELGTFSPSILPIIFQEQSKKWEPLALAYISNVIGVVHTFTYDLMTALCPNPRVLSNLWALITDDLVEGYKKAMSHTQFILQVERKGTPLTMNHYFNDNLQRARFERIKCVLRDQAVEIEPGSGVHMVNVDTISDSIPMGNTEHTVEDIHAILKSYYKVARKRFVDVVCMQAADHFLVTGSESPLRLFTPSFVHQLSPEILNTVAGEEVISKRARIALVQEIKSLNDGKKLLRS